MPNTITGNENNSKQIKKYTPNRRKKPEVSIPKKGEIKKYKYYSDNFKEKDPYSEKLTKEDKIKKPKEKAKNIEKNRQKINFKNVEQQREEQNNNMLNNNNIAYKNSQNINLNSNNKWSKAKFELLNDKELINNIKKLEDDNSPLIGLEFGGGNSQQSDKNEGLNLKVGVRQGDISFKNIPRPKDLVLNNTNIKNQLNFENNKSTMPNIKCDLNKNKNIRINKKISLNNQNNNSCGNIISKDKANVEVPNKNKKNNLNLNINNFYYSKSMEKDDQDFVENNDYIKKIEELDKEIIKLRKENEKMKKVRESYETLNLKIQNDIREFNKKKENEIKKFEKYKEEETKKLIKERRQIINEQKQLNELKIKYQSSNDNASKRDREEIELLRIQFEKFQEDSKKKESNNKLIIERYKNQIEEANNKILELNGLLSRLQPKEINK